jgi:hypothetical protein
MLLQLPLSHLHLRPWPTGKTTPQILLTATRRATILLSLRTPQSQQLLQQLQLRFAAAAA